MTAGVSNNLGYSAAYTYSGDGLRLRVQETGALYPDLWLQYDGVRPVVEGTLEGDTWTTTARNVWEGDSYYSPLVLRLLPSGGYNYLADGLGSTRQLMRHSDHTITDTYAYDAFGNTLTSTGTTDNPYRYVGGLGYRAGGGGLMQLGVREYWPEVGRLSSPEPLSRVNASSRHSFAGGPYIYAADSPTGRTDPTGLFDSSVCMIVCLLPWAIPFYSDCLTLCTAAGDLGELRKMIDRLVADRNACFRPRVKADCLLRCPGSGNVFERHCYQCCDYLQDAGDCHKDCEKWREKFKCPPGKK